MSKRIAPEPAEAPVEKAPAADDNGIVVDDATAAAIAERKAREAG